MPAVQVALSASINLDLGTTLLFSGLYNILSGVGFRIPMCVQVRGAEKGEEYGSDFCAVWSRSHHFALKTLRP
jgi:hypothetical protein